MRRLLLLLTMIPLLTACITEEEFDNTPQGNFEALWKIMDQHYCFFQQKGVDWDSIHQVYKVRVNEKMSDDQLFEVMANMLGELKDGHVNLYYSGDVARNWSWKEKYATNFSDSLFRRYMGTDYKISGSLQYRVLDDNIGYIYCGSFSSNFGSGNLDDVIYSLSFCRGLILDVRGNPGGMLTSANTLAARFFNEETLVGYMQHKTGPGHNDFSKMDEQRLKPSSGMRWQKKVVVLTNRSVYSAANEFVKYMKLAPNAVIVGDRTGGGAGMPYSNALPNGWNVRFSACPMYDVNQQTTEFGIDPDHKVGLTRADFDKGIDTIIEYARKLISQ